ncbi:MAG: F0F1 ATP synthase subunit B [Isosphaeraceae bacterium]|nr:F0F1 ATP synthase subunit B [Isosphaeraceae bacterium]
MLRQSILALGLLGLALAVGPRPAQAQNAATAAQHAAEVTSGEPTTEHGTAGHGGSETPNILEFKPPLALATLIVFLVLLLVLWRFAWGPLSQALAERERNLERTLEETERNRAESERLLAEHNARLAQATEEVRALIERARRDAEATAQGIIQKAQEEAESARQRAERDINSAKDQALMEIWSKTADLAISVAGKVLERQLSADDHRRLVEVALNELPAAPVDSNGHGGRS